jgi:two-component system, NarL family, response regulator NreC
MATQVKHVRILIASEHCLFRQAVRIALDRETNFAVAAEADNGHEAVDEARRVRPDVAILDAALPNYLAIRATAKIKEQHPQCQVLIFGDEGDLDTLIGAVEAGASGYVTKESPLSELIGAIGEVRLGRALIPPHMLAGLLAELLGRRREQQDALRKISKLTTREKQVLALLCNGAGNVEIGRILVISPRTARTHIQNILEKLGVHSRLEAAALASRNAVREELAVP